jgi:hypothetical protein
MSLERSAAIREIRGNPRSAPIVIMACHRHRDIQISRGPDTPQ